MKLAVVARFDSGLRADKSTSNEKIHLKLHHGSSRRRVLRFLRANERNARDLRTVDLDGEKIDGGGRDRIVDQEEEHRDRGGFTIGFTEKGLERGSTFAIFAKKRAPYSYAR